MKKRNGTFVLFLFFRIFAISKYECYEKEIDKNQLLRLPILYNRNWSTRNRDTADTAALGLLTYCYEYEKASAHRVVYILCSSCRISRLWHPLHLRQARTSCAAILRQYQVQQGNMEVVDLYAVACPVWCCSILYYSYV